MADKKKVNVDDFDFDTELDFDNFDFDVDANINPDVKKSKSRTPVDNVTKGVMEGAVSKAKDPAFLGTLVKRAMPDTFEEITNVAGKVTDTISGSYDEAVRELKPQVSRLAKKVDKLVPDDGSRFKKVTSRIASFFGIDDDEASAKMSKERVQDQSIALGLGQIFSEHEVAREKAFSQQAANDQIQDTIRRKEFKTNASLFNSINDNTTRLATYQEKVTNQVQKKSLELQYRSLFALRDIAESNHKYFEIFRLQNEAIAKNTALPEFVKIKTSERFIEMGRSKFIDKIQNNFFGSGSVIDKGLKRLRRDISDYIQGIRSGLEAANMGVDEVENLRQMNEDLVSMGMEPISKANMAGNVAGAWLMEMTGNKAADWLKEKTEKMPGLNKYLYKTANAVNNLPGTLNEFRNTEEYQERMRDMGLKGKLAEGADVLMSYFTDTKPDLRVNNPFGHSNNNPAIFNDKTQRSIVDIIPGFLARILKEITIFRTGDDKTSMTYYDFKNGKFVDKKTMKKSIDKSLEEKIKLSGYGYTVKQMTSKFTEGETTTEKQKDKVSEFLSKLSAIPNLSFTPENIYKTEVFKALDKDTKKLVQAILDKKITNSESPEEGQYQLTKQMMAMRNSTPDIRGALETLIKNGYGEILEEQKLAKQNESGDFEIDEKAYLKMVRDHGLIKSDETAKQGIVPYQPNRALRTIQATDIYDWEYKPGQGDDIRHIGPMAQEVHKRLGNGAAPNGKQIDLTSMNGVNMAAIKALADRQDKAEEAIEMVKPHNKGKTEDNGLLEQISVDVSAIRKLIGEGSFGNVGRGGPMSGKDLIREIFGRVGSGIVDTVSTIGKTGFQIGKGAINTGKFLNQKLNLDGKAASIFGMMLNSAGAVAKKALEVGQDVLLNKLPAGWKQAVNFGGKLKDFAKKMFNRVQDVYIQGKLTPVLRASLLKAGYYRDQATGKVLETMDDLANLKGNVINKAGEVVLTIEEASTGLYNQHGDLIRTSIQKLKDKAMEWGSAVLERGANVLKTGFSIGSKLTGGAFNRLSGFGKKAKKKIGEMDGINIGFGGDKIYQVLVEIRDLVRGGNPPRHEDVLAEKKKPIPANNEIYGPPKPNLKQKLKSKISDFFGKKNPKDKKEPVIEEREETQPVAERNTSRELALFQPNQNQQPAPTPAQPQYVNNNSSLLPTGAMSLLNTAGSVMSLLPGIGRAKGLMRLLPGKGKDIAPVVPQAAPQLTPPKQVPLLGNSTKEQLPQTQPQFTYVPKQAPVALGYEKLKQLAAPKQEQQKQKKRRKLKDVEDVEFRDVNSRNDRDGNGRRDGSWEDRYDEMKRKDEAAKANQPGFDKIEAKYTGTSMLSGLASKISGIFSGAGDLLSSAKDVLGLSKKGMGLLGRLGQGAMGLLGLGSKGAAAASAASTATSAVTGIGRLASIAGTVRNIATVGALATGGAGSVILGGLSAGLTIVGGILSSPVILGTIAVAAAGYGIYRLYKYATRDNVNEYEAIRMMQYGVGTGEATKKYNHFMLVLEEYLCDGRVGFDSGQAYLLDKKIDPKDLLEIFSIDEDDKEGASKFAQWFQKRFKPFFLTHLTALYAADKKAKLKDISSLDPKTLLKYINAVSFESGPYDVSVSPFKDLPNLNTDKTFAMNAIKALTMKLSKNAKLDISKDKAPPVPPPPAVVKPIATKSPPEPKPNLDQNKELNKNQNLSSVMAEDGNMKEMKATSDLPDNKSAPGISKLVKADGPISDGANGMQYLKLQPGVKIDTMNPSMMKNLLAMAQEYGEKTGSAITMTSGTRTTAEQEALFRSNPSKAARPGFSMHEFGLAADVSSGDLDKLDEMGLMRKYGFTRPVGGEPWHMESAGVQINLARAKQDPDFASQAIEASLFKGGSGVGSIPGTQLGKRNTSMALSLMDSSDTTASKDSSIDKVKDRLIPEPQSQMASVPPTNVVSIVGKRMTDQEKKDYDKAEGKQNTNNVYSFAKATKQADNYSKSKDLPEPSSMMASNSPTGTNNPEKEDSKSSNTGDVRETIVDIAKKQNVNPDEILTFAAMESSLNPNARASGSSAKGLYGYTNATWNYQLQKDGPKLNLGNNPSPMDVEDSTLMATEYFKTNKKLLSSVKSDVNVTDIYLAHFLGPNGARKFLSSDPNEIAANVVPSAAAANRTYFYEGNRALTVGEVYAKIDQKLGRTAKTFGINLRSNNTLQKRSSSPESTSTPVVQAAESSSGTNTSTQTSQQSNSIYRSGGGQMGRVAPSMPSSIYTPQTPVMRQQTMAITSGKLDNIDKTMTESLSVLKVMSTTLTKILENAVSQSTAKAEQSKPEQQSAAPTPNQRRQGQPTEIRSSLDLSRRSI